VGRSVPQPGQRKKVALAVTREMSFGMGDGNFYVGDKSMPNIFEAGNSKGYEM